MEWAQKIADICGWRGRFVPTSNRYTDGPMQHVVADTSAIRTELGYAELCDPDAGLLENVMFHAFQRRGRAYAKGY